MDVRRLTVQPDKGRQTRDAAAKSSQGKGDLSKIKDNTGAEPTHAKWSRVSLVCKESELQKLHGSGKVFQEEL